MKKDLLICIAHHSGSADRLNYLSKVVNNFENYKVSFDIIIDTNTDDLEVIYRRNIHAIVHKNLEHPFHLTWCHRQHFKDNIDNYETFLYCEDDMLIPYANYLNYLENFKLLWPHYVPSFVRIEEKNGEQYISDVPEKQRLNIVESSEGKMFTALPFPYNYHAFWIMPQKELKEVMHEGFVQMTDGREFAASYVAWELGKKALVEIEDNQISKKCFSYHLPNTYALWEGHPNGKIKINEIFI